MLSLVKHAIDWVCLIPLMRRFFPSLTYGRLIAVGSIVRAIELFAIRAATDDMWNKMNSCHFELSCTLYNSIMTSLLPYKDTIQFISKWALTALNWIEQCDTVRMLQKKT